MRLLRVLPPKHEKGWVRYPGQDDAALDAPGVLIFCPLCAAAVFGYRLDVAVEHLCTWKPVPSDAHGPSAKGI